MKLFKQSMFAVAALTFCSAIFAAPRFPDCPPVVNYHVAQHNADNSRCVYVANERDFGGLYKPKKCTFFLTDPHYRVISCKYIMDLRRCSCVVTRVQ